MVSFWLVLDWFLKTQLIGHKISKLPELPKNGARIILCYLLIEVEFNQCIETKWITLYCNWHIFSDRLFHTKLQNYPFIQMLPSKMQANWICTILLMRVYSNLTWNIPWLQWSTTVWKRALVLNNPPEWLPWITPAKMPVIIF